VVLDSAIPGVLGIGEKRCHYELCLLKQEREEFTGQSEFVKETIYLSHQSEGFYENRQMRDGDLTLSVSKVA